MLGLGELEGLGPGAGGKMTAGPSYKAGLSAPVECGLDQSTVPSREPGLRVPWPVPGLVRDDGPTKRLSFAVTPGAPEHSPAPAV